MLLIFGKRAFFLIVSILLICIIKDNRLFAQRLKIGKNLGNFKPNVLLELDDSNQALLLTRVWNPATSIAKSYKGMLVYDSSKNQLTFYNGTQWVYPSTNVLDTNIYRYNGAIRNNRRIILGKYTFTFSNELTDSLVLNSTKGGFMGINTPTPERALDVKGGLRADSVVLTNLPRASDTDYYLTININTGVIGIGSKVGTIQSSYCNYQLYDPTFSYATAGTRVIYKGYIWSNNWYANPKEYPGLNAGQWTKGAICAAAPPNLPPYP